MKKKEQSYTADFLSEAAKLILIQDFSLQEIMSSRPSCPESPPGIADIFSDLRMLGFKH